MGAAVCAGCARGARDRRDAMKKPSPTRALEAEEKRQVGESARRGGREHLRGGDHTEPLRGGDAIPVLPDRLSGVRRTCVL